LRDLANFNHEAVRLWFRKLKDEFPKPERRCRKIIAVDETKLKLSGKQIFVWAVSLEAKKREVLACRISCQRNIVKMEAFLRRVLETRNNKPLIIVDK